jgi:hypothetical protein
VSPHTPTIQIAEDNFSEVAAAVLAAHDSGDLAAALSAEGGFKKWANALGKAQKRKGKRLFMPLRIALTVGACVCGAEMGPVRAWEGGSMCACAWVAMDRALRVEWHISWLSY